MIKKYFVLILAFLMVSSIVIRAELAEEPKVVTIAEGGTVPEPAERGYCPWNPGDPYKMHYPQLPDEAGWSVNATAPYFLADDFMCSETGWIKDIHFWGSWRSGNEGALIGFVVSLHSDIPAGWSTDICYADGDANGDGTSLTVADLVYLIAYLSQGGPAPVALHSCDFNGDCTIDVADAQIYSDYFTYGMSVFDPYGGYPVQTCCYYYYSRPGPVLKEIHLLYTPGTPIDSPTMIGWYDPTTLEVIPDNHQTYYQYDFCLDEVDWFWQEQGTIYWLKTGAVVLIPDQQWGWISSLEHWNDDAARTHDYDPAWFEIYEPTPDPGDPIYNWFWVAFGDGGAYMDGSGSNYYGNGWYNYPSGWWNIWFYDNPLNMSRWNNIHLEFSVIEVEPTWPNWVTLAVNYTTPWWSFVGNPPGEPRVPPLPGDDEDQGIIREILLDGPDYFGYYVIDIEIPDYNPEWISIDLIASNVFIDGDIIHTCNGWRFDEQSLDLSFVISATGEVCDCIPGDANNDGGINLGDAGYIVNWIFYSGPDPTPYLTCSGDANCDCSVNLGDAGYIINWIFYNGPTPCDCDTWLSICGPPLRK